MPPVQVGGGAAEHQGREALRGQEGRFHGHDAPVGKAHQGGPGKLGLVQKGEEVFRVGPGRVGAFRGLAFPLAPHVVAEEGEPREVGKDGVPALQALEDPV